MFFHHKFVGARHPDSPSGDHEWVRESVSRLSSNNGDCFSFIERVSRFDTDIYTMLVFVGFGRTDIFGRLLLDVLHYSK
jgi:hypothetical protein